MKSSVTIRHFRAFLYVARHSSFTRAAEEMRLSQPALTMSIRQLETVVGAHLFDRTTRRVVLTPEGRDFARTAERLIEDFDLAFDDVRQAAARRKGRISIAAVFSIATALLPSAARELTLKYPAIRIALRDDNSTGVHRRVRLNEVDIGYTGLVSDDPELDFSKLLRDSLGLVARGDHPLMRLGRDATWADLKQYDFLGWGDETGIKAAMRGVPDLPQSVRFPRYEVSNTPTVEAMLSAGLGVAVLPSLALQADGAWRGLKFRLLTAPVIRRDVYVVTRRNRPLSKAAESFKALVQQGVERLARTGRIELPGIGATVTPKRRPRRS